MRTRAICSCGCGCGVRVTIAGYGPALCRECRMFCHDDAGSAAVPVDEHEPGSGGTHANPVSGHDDSMSDGIIDEHEPDGGGTPASAGSGHDDSKSDGSIVGGSGAEELDEWCPEKDPRAPRFDRATLAGRVDSSDDDNNDDHDMDCGGSHASSAEDDAASENSFVVSDNASLASERDDGGAAAAPHGIRQRVPPNRYRLSSEQLCDSKPRGFRDAALRLAEADLTLGWEVHAEFLGWDDNGSAAYRVFFDWDDKLVGEASQQSATFRLANGADCGVVAESGCENALLAAMQRVDTYPRILDLERTADGTIAFVMVQLQAACELGDRGGGTGLYVAWLAGQAEQLDDEDNDATVTSFDAMEDESVDGSASAPYSPTFSAEGASVLKDVKVMLTKSAEMSQVQSWLFL